MISLDLCWSYSYNYNIFTITTLKNLDFFVFGKLPYSFDHFLGMSSPFYILIRLSPLYEQFVRKYEILIFVKRPSNFFWLFLNTISIILNFVYISGTHLLWTLSNFIWFVDFNLSGSESHLMQHVMSLHWIDSDFFNFNCSRFYGYIYKINIKFKTQFTSKIIINKLILNCK